MAEAGVTMYHGPRLRTEVLRVGGRGRDRAVAGLAWALGTVLAGAGEPAAAAAPGPWRTYEIYRPTVERVFVYDARTGSLQYNHDSSIAWFAGRWFCLWNANEPAAEGKPGQRNVMSTSADGRQWTDPVPCFSDPRYGEPAVPCGKGTQWQPNLLVVGDELWAVWCQHSRDEYNGVYLSRRQAADGVWHSTRILFDGRPDVELDGQRFSVFPTQDPVRLRSGRVLAPVTLTASTDAADAPPAAGGLESWWRREKRDSVLYTGDLGKTWRCSAGAVQPGRTWAQWEPTVWECADGTVMMVARNNDLRPRQAGGPRPAEMLTWSRSTDGGVSWTPHGYVPLETVASRMHVLPAGGDRFLMVHNDWPAGRFVDDRRNLALFSSRGGGTDFVAGPSLTGPEPFVMYPQMAMHDGRLLVSYSQGHSVRSIKVAHLWPLPDPAGYYVFPRGAAPAPERPEDAATALHLDGGRYAETRAVVDPGTARLSLGAWVRPDDGGALFDNRGGEPAGGWLFGLSGGHPFVFLGTKDHNIVSELQVRGEVWSYVGVTVDAAAGWVEFVVNGETERRVLQERPSRPLRGTTARLGHARPENSLVPAYRGDLRWLALYAEVGLTREQHRGLANRLAGELRATALAPGQPVEAQPTLAFDPADPAALASRFGVGGQAPDRGAAEPVEVEGLQMLRLRGEGAAGVDLDANRRAAGDAVTLSVRFRTEAGPAQVLATLGDANQPARLVARGEQLVLEAAGLPVTVGPVRPGQWTEVELSTCGVRTTARLGAGAAATVEHRPEGTWIYLGQGYRTGQFPAAATTLIDIGSLRSRVTPGP